MKAIVYTKYGSPDVLHLKEIQKPVPKDNEVLVKVHAAALIAADWHLLRGDPFFMRIQLGLFKPKFSILGADIAGRVEAVGRNVKLYQAGDEVFGDISGCGFGGFAEYVCVDENALALKPVNLSFEEAAAVPLSAITALQGLRDKGEGQPGQRVLIHGASGGVGTFAVQIAKVFGAEVTAVCSTSKVEMVRSLGADFVIDYMKDDFANTHLKYDLVLAVNGNRPIYDYVQVLTNKGRYVVTGGVMKQIYEVGLLGPLISMTSKRKMIMLLAKANHEDLLFLSKLVETGKITPVIDRRYPLEEVPNAIRYLEGGHAKGKIVVSIAS